MEVSGGTAGTKSTIEWNSQENASEDCFVNKAQVLWLSTGVVYVKSAF